MDEDIFTRIDAYLEQPHDDDDGLGNLIRAIRQCDDYKILLEWPLESDANGWKRLCENALFDHGCPRKLCFRAMTLYVYAADTCRRTDDNVSKREIMRIVKETIEKYNVDWSLLDTDKRSMKYVVVKFLAFFAFTVFSYIYVK